MLLASANYYIRRKSYHHTYEANSAGHSFLSFLHSQLVSLGSRVMSSDAFLWHACTAFRSVHAVAGLSSHADSEGKTQGNYPVRDCA